MSDESEVPDHAGRPQDASGRPVEKRRHRASWIGAIAGAVILFAGLVLAAADMFHTSNPVAAQAGMSVKIETRNYGFVPTTLIFPANATVTITIHNRSISAHTFTSEELGVDMEILPGATRTFVVHTRGRATIPFYCRFHENFGMRGRVVVR